MKAYIKIFLMTSFWSNELSFAKIIHLNACGWINHNRRSDTEAALVRALNTEVTELQPVIWLFSELKLKHLGSASGPLTPSHHFITHWRNVRSPIHCLFWKFTFV